MTFNNFGNQLTNQVTNQPKLTQAQWKEFQEFKEEYLKKLTINNHLFQEINDQLESGLTSFNLMSFRNTMAFNEADSLDQDNPFIMDFKIVSETIKIVSVMVSFKILKFRAYSKSAKSGGGSVPTTSSKTTPSGGGATSGLLSDLVGLSCGPISTVIDTDGTGCKLPTSDDFSIISAHKHTTPNHTHPSHSHTVTIADHSHDINFGIHQEDSSPTIHFFISEDESDTMWKGKHGGYTKDQDDIDIASYLTRGNGNKRLKFTSDVRCRISACVLIKFDLKARKGEEEKR